ncbi:cytochrome c biogenesis protein CcsA [Spirochaetia bacterium 38H-sp]|uniref:Cytochrome c biogenesis protein CcsA n=1 Tax=Rarispira pelagica TaxID=3141764 RepID=A0ABU9UA34_9SPIR
MNNIILFAAWAIALLHLLMAIVFMIKPFSEKAYGTILFLFLALVISLMLYNTINLGVLSLISLHDVFLSLSLMAALIAIFIKKDIVARLALSFASWIAISLAMSPLAPPPGSVKPVLASAWLILHVLTSIAGESLIYAGGFILVARLISKKDRGLGIEESLIYWGYLFFTAGALIFGAVWAYFAWGSFWSWDAKETWSLITWLMLTAYVHLSPAYKKKNWARAVILLAIVFMLFTLLGVPYLFDGKHSYG